MPNAVTAVAPGSIGNFGPGLDVLGCALTGAADRVTVRRVAGTGIALVAPGAAELPRDGTRHAATLAADAVRRRAGVAAGLAVSCEKGLPLAGGQGGSAASAVAAAVATNRVLGDPLSHRELLACCLDVEATVAGRHLDNLAPSLLGGIVLVRSLDPIDVQPLPVPRALRIALALPRQQLATATARAALPAAVPREAVVRQLASVAAVVHALHTGDLEQLGAAMLDAIAEPARAPLIPGFVEARRAALANGALGATISGAGPTIFALAADDAMAQCAAQAMHDTFATLGIACTVRVARVDEAGAQIVAEEASP
jgi:homoserine kinase